ncbi:3-oxoacyl-ACP synthase III family protein [Sorangium sp. So ce131]|uniref:3-oxoacyl-ACP synthase III family protein n=1 Tax=Sorangium sp. So ce131 TaxID=3133282 RepID=UPI003F6076F2
MREIIHVGIWGIGTYLPPNVRTNDWWPKELVACWREKRAAGVTRPVEADRQLSPAAAALTRAMAAYKDDPFEGAIERRVLSDDMEPSDMELSAAREALARSGALADQVDALLIGGTVPDFQQNSSGCRLHRELELRPGVLTLQTEGTCNAFAQQVAVARALIGSGQARCVLAVQSSAQSRVLRPEDPFSVWFGDGATAVVLGPVPAGEGVLGEAHLTDGRFYGALVTGVPGKRWTDQGKNVLYLADPRRAREQLFAIAEHANPMLDQALAAAGLGRKDIGVIVTHQAAGWFGSAIQAIWGLPEARRTDTFAWASSLSGANLPMVMATGEREGILRPGDVVATVSGATGMTMTVMVMRWGRYRSSA